MPTSSALNTARDTLLANLHTLNQSNPLSPATAQLALLSLIADNAGGGGGGTTGSVTVKDAAGTNLLAVDGSGRITTVLSGAQRTPSFLNVTTSGTIAAGARKVNIANIGTVAGTVLGVSLPASVSIPFEVNGADTLSAIAYDATNTNFLITVIV